MRNGGGSELVLVGRLKLDGSAIGGDAEWFGMSLPRRTLAGGVVETTLLRDR
jgi:hypothetical protein